MNNFVEVGLIRRISLHIHIIKLYATYFKVCYKSLLCPKLRGWNQNWEILKLEINFVSGWKLRD